MSEATALTVIERAVLALGKKDYGPTLVALAEASKSITVITNPDGYQQCHAARMALKTERVQISNDGKKARDDANAFNKAVIAEEKRLISIIEPEETRLETLQKAWDDARQAEKEAKIAAELERVESLQERVAELRGNQMLSPSSGSKLIAEHIQDLEALAVDESFQEFEQQAADAKGAGLKRLQDLHAAALSHEAEQERLRAEREELVRLRAENARRDAEDRARREAEEREAKKAREVEEARAAEQRRIQRANDDREAELRRKALAEQEATAKLARDAESARLKEEREAHEAKLRAEREQQEAAAKVERERIAADRAELERQQAALKKAQEPTPIAPTKMRPKASVLVGAVAAHFSVTTDTALQWLRATDFSKAQDAA